MLVYTNGRSAGEKSNTSGKVVKTKSLKIKVVFLNQSSTEHLQGFRQESLNKYIRILKYSDILTFEKIGNKKKQEKCFFLAT